MAVAGCLMISEIRKPLDRGNGWLRQRATRRSGPEKYDGRVFRYRRAALATGEVADRAQFQHRMGAIWSSSCDASGASRSGSPPFDLSPSVRRRWMENRTQHGPPGLDALPLRRPETLVSVPALLAARSCPPREHHARLQALFRTRLRVNARRQSAARWTTCRKDPRTAQVAARNPMGCG